MSNELNNPIDNESVNEHPTSETTEKTSDNKTYTQDDVNKIVADRLAREKKKTEKFADYDELKTRLAKYESEAEERKKAEMSEIERLQHEKEAAEQRAKEIETKQSEAFAKANKRLIDAELKVALKEAGVRTDALNAALKLFDVSGVEVDEEGSVKGVTEALEAFRKDNAFMFGATQHADPSPGNHEVKREDEKAKAMKQLAEAEALAKKTGRIEDRMKFASLKKRLGL